MPRSGPNLFTEPPPGRPPLVAPSLLAADFAALGDEACHALAPAPAGAGADLLHVDVMDGHFVPNLTMGPALVGALRRWLPGAFLDVHLMVTDPQQFVEPFANAGADHLTIHIEPALDRRSGTGLSPLSEGYDPRALARRIRDAGMSAGLAINPPTAPTDAVLDALDGFELVLVMSVNPGFGGQAFIAETLETVRVVRARVGPGVRVQMDGGIDQQTAPACRDAGCDVLVAGSAVFGLPRDRRSGAVEAIRSAR